jgi:hypothetical protein
MKIIPFSILLLAGLAGCATDLSDQILLGQWGGDELGIRATASSVVVTMPCGAKGIVSTTVPLDPEGGFEIETVIHQFYGDYGITLEGRKIGRFLEVEVYPSRPGSQPPTYLLVSGVVPDFTAYVCLGATP